MITEQQDKELQQLGYTGDVAMDIDKAIRWMQEVKGVHVALSTNEYHSEWICHLQVKGQYEPISVIDEDSPSKSHDHAQSAGLDAAIDYVKMEQL